MNPLLNEGFVFPLVNGTLLGLFALLAALPLLSIVFGSFASVEETRRGFFLIPKTWSLVAYRYVFSSSTLLRAFLTSVGITVVGTGVSMAMSILLAYALAEPGLRGGRQLFGIVLFTMLFNGGMVPTYLVVRAAGLINSYWSMILPSAMSAFNVLVMSSFFRSFPGELKDAARIDGCGEINILVRVVLPLSMAPVATFSLFYAVAKWNSYMPALLYVNRADRWPIQILLRQVVMLATFGLGDAASMGESFLFIPPESVKMAVVVVATVPILLVYPFLQRHFVKGLMIGSLKG